MHADDICLRTRIASPQYLQSFQDWYYFVVGIRLIHIAHVNSKNVGPTTLFVRRWSGYMYLDRILQLRQMAVITKSAIINTIDIWLSDIWLETLTLNAYTATKLTSYIIHMALIRFLNSYTIWYGDKIFIGHNFEIPDGCLSTEINAIIIVLNKSFCSLK
jgi:hypothetical protein